MGGNFTVRREIALKLGGFDEQFVSVAYNFESEFAYRLCKAGHRIFYEPAASVHHLRSSEGGTRTFGDHLRSFRPNHAVGAYYFILRTWSGWQSLVRFLSRPLRCDRDTTPPFSALVDPSHSCRGIFRNDLGSCSLAAQGAALFEFAENHLERRGIEVIELAISLLAVTCFLGHSWNGV